MGSLKLAIIGTGLIGMSVARAARRAWPDADILTLDRGDSVEPAEEADVVVLATPVDAILDILSAHGPRFGRALVMDTGSTKRTILAAARRVGMTRFVGGHPMAGAAVAGAAGARADLFDDRPWFLIGLEPRADAVADASRFVQALGARPIVMTDDGQAHDRLVAAISHTPQVVASILMSVVGEAAGAEGLSLSASGLRDTTRLAGSAASMWESVLSTNAREIAPLLERVGRELIAFAQHLEDGAAVRAVFAAANEQRRLLDQHPTPQTPAH